jgi:hypothetical protein
MGMIRETMAAHEGWGSRVWYSYSASDRRKIEGSRAVMSWRSLGVSCLMTVVLCLRFMLEGGRFDILYSMRLAAFFVFFCTCHLSRQL